MIRLLTILLATVLSISTAHTAGLYPLSRNQVLDANSRVLAGAKLYLFDGGTTTPRVAYKDSSLTSKHPNPIVADSAGRLPLIYLADGFYRQRLTTSTGSQIFDDDGIPVLSVTAGGSGTSVDPDAVYKTRDVKVRFDNQPISGYVRLNGRTIGNAASGATERANVDTQPLYEELWQMPGIVIVGGKGASSSADFAANKQLVLPNAAGRGIFGADDIGAGAQNILTSATIASPTVIGSVGGSQTLTISQAMLPNYLLTGGSGNASVSGTTGKESATHTHSGSGTTDGMSANNPHSHTTYVRSAVGRSQDGGSFTDLWSGQTLGAQTSSTDINHTHNYAFTTGPQDTDHNHTFSGAGAATNVSILSGGGGAASPNLPPVMLFTIYVRL